MSAEAMRHHVRIAAVAMAIMLPCLAGCGEWWLGITDVMGKVIVDGKPAKSVMVIFQPEVKELPRAIGTTDADGAYRLARVGLGRKIGAAAGKYVVKVRSDSEDGKGVRIPAEYAGDSSPLSFEVVSGKQNVFDINITSK
jgi:hypothetical protein